MKEFTHINATSVDDAVSALGMYGDKAMVLAGDTVFIAGAPLIFKPDAFDATYKGHYGGILWAVSAKDGSKMAEHKLQRLPRYDGIVAAYGKLYIANQDASIECWAANTQ